MDVSLLRHNQSVLRTLEKGDMIELPRGAYSHWALYIGDEEVVHLAGDENDGVNARIDSVHLFTVCGKSFKKAFVRRESFWNILLDSKAKKNNGKDRKLKPLSKDEIVERALSKLGEIGYNVLWNNCEHFASWCRYDSEWSEQANNFLWGAGSVLVGMAAAGLMYMASSGDKKEKRQTS